jgi:hypothetical protein
MPPIDAGIYSQIRQPQQPDLIGQAGQFAQLQGAQQQNRLLDMKMQQAQREQQQDDAQREAVRGFGTDTAANTNRLLSTGNLKAATDYQTTVTNQEKAKREAEKAKIEAEVQKLGFIGQTLTGVNDPMTYNAARQRIIQAIPEAASEMPEAFNPQEVETARSRSLTVKDQLEQQWKAMEYTTPNANARLSADTSVRNNDATNATSRANNTASVGASYANAAATRDAAKETAAATRDAAKIKDNRDTEMKLADDYRNQGKSFKEVSDAYKQISATLDKATTSPAATLAAATKFMKLLDPGSVVRESELGMALAASGVIDRAMNYHNVLLRGKVLTEQQAKDFKNITGQIYKAAQGQQQSIDANYKRQAQQYGLRPEMIVQDLGQNAGAPAAPPAPAAKPEIDALLKKYGGN